MTCVNAVSFHEDPSIESICRRIIDAGFDTVELSRPPFFNKLTTAATRSRFSDWSADLDLRLYGFDCWVDVLPYTAMKKTLGEFLAAVRYAEDLQLGMLISHDPWMKDNDKRSPTE